MTSKVALELEREFEAMAKTWTPGSAVPVYEEYRDLLDLLEGRVQELLREQHPRTEWRHESLDGLFPKYLRHPTPSRLEVYGLTVLITDQTLTPFWASAESTSAGLRLRARVGRVDDDGLVSVEFDLGQLARLPENPEAVVWAYIVDSRDGFC